MNSTRRLTLAALCVTSLTAALLAASPAGAAQPTQHRDPACGAAPSDYDGTFAGLFNRTDGDTVSVTFSAPRAVATQWNVNGWSGSGRGEYELGATGPQWTNSNTVSGPIMGTDSEVYRSGEVSCDNGGSQVTRIAGVVDSGSAQIPFVIDRQN
ncbi:hypothetical protein GCM10009760_15640 [Kitasatospora kazusensis]|uniref:Uncharacterized protein n=1 Tax=Kitasatospora kazusensis TaxID=407974 RepID=A0ABN2Z3N4_9ACTN